MLQIKKFSPENHFLKALIYGEFGTGKTILSATAPKPFYVCIDDGLVSLVGMVKKKKFAKALGLKQEEYDKLPVIDKEENVDMKYYQPVEMPDFVTIKTIDDLQEIIKLIKRGELEYETIVFDTLTDLGNMVEKDLQLKNGKTTMNQDLRGKHKGIFISMMDALRDIKYHLLFLAHENAKEDEEGTMSYGPLMSGQSGLSHVLGKMDIAARLTFKKGKRTLAVNSDQQTRSKTRINIINDSLVVQDIGEWINSLKSINKGPQKVIKEIEVNVVRTVEEIVAQAGGERLKEECIKLYNAVQKAKDQVARVAELKQLVLDSSNYTAEDKEILLRFINLLP